MTVARVAFECAKGVEKPTLRRSGLNRQHPIEQAGDARRTGARYELIGEPVEHGATMVIKQARHCLIGRRR